ncbi:MAG TPA: MFS transporter, partial [Burkholderiales bacterium]|nr:MFS transporter [Burkholderiales bacterium]
MNGSTAASAATSAASLKRDGTTTVTLVVVCQVFHGLTFGALALFLPLVREDLQISFSQAGILSAAATLSYGIGQVPAGFLADRFGPSRLFFIGLIGWSALSLNLGLIHSYWFAVINQLVGGAFRALMFAPGLTLLASWFPPERRATAMSLYMVGGFSGTILLSLGGPLLAQYIEWRGAYILLSSLGIAAALVYRVFAKEKPRKASGQRVGILDAFLLLKHRILWVCCGIQFIRFAVVTGFNFWLPSLLVADRGFSLSAAGLVTAMGAAFTAPSNAIGAYVSDRLKNPPLVIGGSLAVLACMSTLLVMSDSIVVLLLVVGVSSVFLQFYFGPLFLVPVEVLGPRTAGTATGISNLFANMGGLLTAYLLGVVKDKAGTFTWGFVGISVLCLIGVALSAILARMRRR